MPRKKPYHTPSSGLRDQPSGSARIFGVNLMVMGITQIGSTCNPGYIWVTRVNGQDKQHVSSLSKAPMAIMVELQQTYHTLIDVLINQDINNVIVPIYFSIHQLNSLRDGK